MLDYDPTFNPPAPVVTVQINNPFTGANVRCRAQIDTGSFMSAIPTAVAETLGLRPHSRVRARSVDRASIELSTYRVNLIVEGQVIVNQEVGMLERGDMLLGRDVLQHFILTLNGKEGKFDLVDP